jgi:hypothetical protein
MCLIFTHVHILYDRGKWQKRNNIELYSMAIFREENTHKGPLHLQQLQLNSVNFHVGSLT